MSSPGTFYPMLQAIAALMTFVAIYLSFVVCTIICLVAAELISKHARVVREYGVNPFPLGSRVSSEIGTETRRSSRQHLANRPSHGSKDTDKILPMALIRNR
jgi:hypothetical protein